jgi:hypothetical protein
MSEKPLTLDFEMHKKSFEIDGSSRNPNLDDFFPASRTLEDLP